MVCSLTCSLRLIHTWLFMNYNIIIMCCSWSSHSTKNCGKHLVGRLLQLLDIIPLLKFIDNHVFVSRNLKVREQNTFFWHSLFPNARSLIYRIIILTSQETLFISYIASPFPMSSSVANNLKNYSIGYLIFFYYLWYYIQYKVSLLRNIKHKYISWNCKNNFA